MANSDVVKEKVFEGWRQLVQAKKMLGLEEMLSIRMCRSHERLCNLILQKESSEESTLLANTVFRSWQIYCIRILRQRWCAPDEDHRIRLAPCALQVPGVLKVESEDTDNSAEQAYHSDNSSFTPRVAPQIVGLPGMSTLVE